jgi:hypothetical protein
VLLLDAGAFIAVESDDRDVVALIKGELRDGRAPMTHGGIIAQVWRGGSGRQARLARLLPGVETAPLDLALGKIAGVLLKTARAKDAIDATLVALAGDGDTILTSEVEDLEALVRAADVHVELVRV